MSITMIGLDSAKSVFQVHRIDDTGQTQLKCKLGRSELIPFFEKQAACTVVIEACGAGHHWARLLGELGHEVKLIPPEAARPFVKRGKKNDVADVKFVPDKTREQQDVLTLHTARSLLIKQQTMVANAMRGLATEFEFVVPKGIGKLEELAAAVEADGSLPAEAQQAIGELHRHCNALGARIATFEVQIIGHARTDAVARLLATIPGVGLITASLIAATVGDHIRDFKSARHFAAWLGLVPRQHSTGGKTRLGRITRMGNADIRRLLVLGATSMVYRAEQWNSATGNWIVGVLRRRPARLATVALANKMARIAWAVMTRKEVSCPNGRAAAKATA